MQERDEGSNGGEGWIKSSKIEGLTLTLTFTIFYFVFMYTLQGQLFLVHILSYIGFILIFDSYDSIFS